MAVRNLEKTVDLAGLRIHIHVQISGGGRQAGDRLDIGSQSITGRMVSIGSKQHKRAIINGGESLQITGSHGQSDVPDGNRKARGRSLQSRVVTE